MKYINCFLSAALFSVLAPNITVADYAAIDIEVGEESQIQEFAALLGDGIIGNWAGVGCAPGEIYFNADGSAKVTFGRGEVNGTWALKGNAVCTSWATLRDGRESCAVYHHLDGNNFQSFQMMGRVEGFTTFN
jgi:hypothetical protein